MLLIDYYHAPIFHYLIEVHGERIRENMKELPKVFRERLFLAELEQGHIYSGEEGWERCEAYLRQLEKEISRVLSRHSVFFWLHIYRRIGVHLPDFLEGKTDANTIALVRQIVELAISKYGDLSREDEFAHSSTVHLKDVLGGHYKRLWSKWDRAGLALRFSQLKASSQFVLTTFSIGEFLSVFYVEGLAYRSASHRESANARYFPNGRREHRCLHSPST